MGQIIGGAAKPDACNIRSLSSFGVPAAGQHILVSTDNSAMQNGQGNFDAYVVGDGTTAATELELKRINSEIGNMSSLVTYEDLDFSSISTIAYFTGDTTWTSYSNYTSKIIPLSNGVSFIKVTAGSYDTYLYLLNNGTAPTNTGQTPSFANGETHRRTIAAGTTVVITLPNDCTYIAIGVWAGKNVQPSRIEEGVNNTIVDAIEDIQETTKDAVFLANQLVKSTTILESSITWTSGKGLVADPSNADYGNLTTSSVVKTSDYVGLPKGIITFTLPTYQSSTSFGVIFYDVNKQAQHSIVLPVTGSYGYQDYTFENTDYSYGRFVWFQSSSYGNFSITIKYADILNEQDVKEITENVIINGSEQTITEWTNGKGLIATTTNLGSLNNSSVLSVSGYIDVSNAKSIGLKLVSFESSTTFGFVWYNSSKVAINGTTFEVGGTYEMYDAIIDVPNNAAFLRTCKLQTYTSDFVVSKFIIKDGNSYDKILIAASDSTDFDKARAQYVCTGTNDEAMINRAVSALSPYQDLHFAKGTYYIDSFFTSDDGEEDYVIRFVVGTQNRHRLVCDGAMPCKTSSSAMELGTFANTAKFVITQTCYNNLDSSKQYSIIRCNSYNGSRRYGANSIQVEGLSFILPDNQKKIICIDGKFAAFIEVKNVFASAVADINSLNVPVDGCIGIRGVMGSNFGTGNWIEHCFVWGFNEGYAISGEHLICIDLGARFCNYGFTFNNFTNEVGAWTHPITMINCADECNFNMPLFGHNGESEQTDNLGGRQSITFINFNIEWVSSYYNLGTANHAKELTAGEWFGEIYYVIQTSYGGNSKNAVDTPFWASDGSGVNFKSVNQAQAQQVTKATLRGYAPNFNQVVYVTDLQKPLICTNPNTGEWRDFNGNVVSLT